MKAQIEQVLGQLSPQEQAALLQLDKELDEVQARDAARASFMGYVHHMWPAFIEGRHHRTMGDAFDRILDGSLKRLIVNLGPRHTKSEFASVLLPSKYLGHYPDRKVIQTSHTAELATGFGRRVRNLVGAEDYRQVFPKTTLTADSKAAGRWSTGAGGEYFAIGVGGAVAGKGADLLIIDDPHSEQDYIQALGGDPSAFDKVYEWYTAGPRQRLQPNAAIVIVMTRWHMRDLTGRIIKRMISHQGLDDWELIEFPAIMPESQKPLWPEFWSLEELTATREELSVAQWNAQYLQNPTAEEGALVKREWWRLWESKTPPACEFVIQTWDTAYLAKQQHDYSACTDWGVFMHPDEDGVSRANLILLDAYTERLEFPALKAKAYKRWKRRQPDAFIIEAKASGWPLIFELRQMGVPVADFTPVRGTKANPNDKVARVNGISDLFQSGYVWRPDTRWAEEVEEQFASFPVGDHDDLVDASVIALTRFRLGGFLSMHTDEEEEEHFRHKADYY